MGLDVELTVGGQTLVAVHDTRFRFARVIERAQHGERSPLLLDRIDLYGLLELGSDEMPRFLADLGELVPADPGEREVLEAVRGLAQRCREDPELSLRLIGD